jgi:transposase-like protein
VGGRQYPRTWPEFQRFFPDEQACLVYLQRLRWPDGFRCPICEGSEGWQTKRRLWVCRSCQRQTSVTAGTLFAGTRTPLSSWFAAIWQLVGQKQGMSALGFQKLMGFGSYETAWAHLHKLRRAMVRPGRDLLGGLVEVDESYVGGREEWTRGRETETKSRVAIAVEVKTRGFGRIRLQRVPDVSKASLIGFVTEAVEPGATVRTDGWRSYLTLPEHGYTHERTIVYQGEAPAHVAMPAAHRIASLLKRWLLGTHQGSVEPHQLDYYLDEFTFRFNRRHSRHRGLLFYRLVQEAVSTEPIPLKAIVRGHRGRSGTSREIHI